MKLRAENYAISFSPLSEAVEVHCDLCAAIGYSRRRYILGTVSDVKDVNDLIDAHEAEFHR